MGCPLCGSGYSAPRQSRICWACGALLFDLMRSIATLYPLVELFVTMSPDKPQIAVDPNLAAEQAQAQSSLVASLQDQSQADTATLMSRYGTRLALAGSGMAPMAPVPAPGAGRF